MRQDIIEHEVALLRQRYHGAAMLPGAALLPDAPLLPSATWLIVHQPLRLQRPQIVCKILKI